MPGPRPPGPLSGFRHVGYSHDGQAGSGNQQVLPTQQQASQDTVHADAGAIGTAAAQQTEELQLGDGKFFHKWMLQQDAVAMKLLAGQERLEALLRDSLFSREFTSTSASTGDCWPQKRPKWNCKAAVAESPMTAPTSARSLTAPTSARSAPTPRRMHLPGGGMLSYTATLPSQLSRGGQPSLVLQRLSPRQVHAKVLDSPRYELKDQSSKPSPSLDKPVCVDSLLAANVESKQEVPTTAPLPTSAKNGLSEANFQDDMAETPLGFAKASESAEISPAKAEDALFTEEKEPDKGAQEPKRQPSGKSFRITTLTRTSVEDENGGEGAEETNWDASSHWRKMIRQQEKKASYKWKSKTMEEEKDEKDTCLRAFVKGPIFENIGIALVIVNAVFIGWQVEHYARSGSYWSFRMPLEIIFATLFSVEFLAKAYAWGCKMFSRSPENHDFYWNLFDLTVVLFMWLEIAMELEIIPASEVSSVSILRILRILRLVRIVKILRTLTFFRELRLMIEAIQRGSFCLIWVVGLLVTAFYIFGVSLTQGANDQCPGYADKEDGPEKEALAKLCFNFGSIASSILSLYAAMSGGVSWIELYYAVLPLGFMYIVIFLFYSIFSIFAVANIITGIFVDSAMKSSISDQESMVEEEMRRREEYVNSIHKVFLDLDADGSGTIAVREFEQVVKSNKMAAYFHALGLEITDVKSLFALMDRDRTGAIDIEEFLVGCLRLKGEARSLDLAKLALQTEWMMETLENICERMPGQGGKMVTPSWRQ